MTGAIGKLKRAASRTEAKGSKQFFDREMSVAASQSEDRLSTKSLRIKVCAQMMGGVFEVINTNSTKRPFSVANGDISILEGETS